MLYVYIKPFHYNSKAIIQYVSIKPFHYNSKAIMQYLSIRPCHYNSKAIMQYVSIKSAIKILEPSCNTYQLNYAITTLMP